MVYKRSLIQTQQPPQSSSAIRSEREREREREMGSETPSPRQVPVIDFTGLDPANPGSEGWNSARAQVMQALESCCCFEAVCEEMTPELREALFGGVMKEVFGLPKETKLRNNLEKPFHGYIGGIPGMDYESLAINDAAQMESVRRFADVMWPQGGNPSFCDKTCSFAKILAKLDQIVRRMVLESFGVEKYSDSFIESSFYSLRLAEYGAPHNQDMKISLPSHTDPTLTSLVCQHQVEGLEILTKEDTWITPSQNSITFMIGDAFMAWTNGRLEPPPHRVTFSGDDTRYSVVFGAHPKEGNIVQAPEELVDDEHPLLYKPFDYNDYLQFRFSQAGKETDCILKAFCGVQ